MCLSPQKVVALVGALHAACVSGDDHAGVSCMRRPIASCRSAQLCPWWLRARGDPRQGTFSPLPMVSLCPSADVVNLDLKSTLRVLYNLFTKYKNVE